MPAVVDFVIGSKGITPFWKRLLNVKLAVKLLTPLRAACVCCDLSQLKVTLFLKALGVLVDRRLALAQQRAFVAKRANAIMVSIEETVQQV